MHKLCVDVVLYQGAQAHAKNKEPQENEMKPIPSEGINKAKESWKARRAKNVGRKKKQNEKHKEAIEDPNQEKEKEKVGC